MAIPIRPETTAQLDAIKLPAGGYKPRTTGAVKSTGIMSDLPKFALSGAQRFVGDLGAVVEGTGAMLKNSSVEQAGKTFREDQYKAVAEREKTLSPVGQQVAKADITDIGLFGGDVPTLPFLAGKTAEMLPTTLAGGGIGKGIQVASRGAIGLGKASVIGEALVSAPSGASNQAQKIDATSTEKLLKDSDSFRKAYAANAHLDPVARDAAARTALKADALPVGSLASAAAVTAGSMLAGRISKGSAGGVFSDAADSAKGIIKGTAQGARREALQEASQSFLESIGQDATTAAFIDPEAGRLDSMLKNAAVSSLEGAVLGGTTGGVIGAVRGRANAVEAKKIELRRALAKEAEAAAAKKAAMDGPEEADAAPKQAPAKTLHPLSEMILKQVSSKTSNAEYLEARRRIDSAARKDLVTSAKRDLGISVSDETSDSEIKNALVGMVNQQVFGSPHVPEDKVPGLTQLPSERAKMAPPVAAPVQEPAAVETPAQQPAPELTPVQKMAESFFTEGLGKTVNPRDRKALRSILDTSPDAISARMQLAEKKAEWEPAKGKKVTARYDAVSDALDRMDALIQEETGATIAPEATPEVTPEVTPVAALAPVDTRQVVKDQATGKIRLMEFDEMSRKDLNSLAKEEGIKFVGTKTADLKAKLQQKLLGIEPAASARLPEPQMPEAVVEAAPVIEQAPVSEVTPVAEVTDSELGAIFDGDTAPAPVLEAAPVAQPEPVVAAAQPVTPPPAPAVDKASEYLLQKYGSPQVKNTAQSFDAVEKAVRTEAAEPVEVPAEAPIKVKRTAATAKKAKLTLKKGTVIKGKKLDRAKKADLEAAIVERGGNPEGLTTVEMRTELRNAPDNQKPLDRLDDPEFEPTQMEQARISALLSKANPQEVALLSKISERREEVVRRAIFLEAMSDAQNMKGVFGRIERQLGNVAKAEAAAQEVVEDYTSGLDDPRIADILDAAFPDTNSEEYSDPDSNFRASALAKTDAPGMSAAQVSKAVSSLQSSSSIKMDVVEKESDLPADIRSWLKERELAGTGAVRGIFKAATAKEASRIYLVAENITSEKEAMFVALHEAVHRGLTHTFGANMAQALKGVFNNNSYIRAAVEIQRKENPAMGQVEAIEEVLADLAYAGRARTATMWDRVVEAVNNWLVRHGYTFKKFSAFQIEKIVAGAQRKGLEADLESMGPIPVSGVPNAAPDIRTSVNPAAGPAALMDRTDGVLSTMVKFAESKVPSINGLMHRAHMYFSTGAHTSEFYGRILGRTLNPRVKTSIDAIDGANGKASAIVNKLDVELSEVSNKIASLPEAKQKQFNELAGESTRLGIFPNKPFDDQPWLFENMLPVDLSANKRAYNRLKKLYETEGVTSVYDAALAHTERDFNLLYGSLLKSLTFTFNAPEAVWKGLDVNQLITKAPGDKADFELSVQLAELWMNTQGGVEGAQALKQMTDFRAAKLQAPYFHLGRYGEFFARFKIAKTPEAQAAIQKAIKDSGQSDLVYVADGAEKAFLRMESEQQWLQLRKILTSLEEAGHVEGLQTGQVEENLNAVDSASLTFLQRMMGSIDNDPLATDDQKKMTSELIRRVVVEMMPETTGSKQLARRTGVPGYAIDMRRNLVKRSSANAFVVAHNSTRPELMQGFNDFRNELQMAEKDPTVDPKTLTLATNVMVHLKKRLDNTMKPIYTPVTDMASSLGYTMFLASNPPHILANMAQPFQTTLPVLGGRHGFTKTAGAMFRAFQTASSVLKDSIQDGYDTAGNWKGIIDAHISVDRSDMTPGQKAAMKAFIDSGRLEFTQQHGLGRIAAGENESVGTAMKAIGALSHYSEAINRIVSGLAAYDLEVEKLSKSGTSELEAQQGAIEYGLNMIGKTQFLYDTDNRSLAMSKRGMFGQVTPLVMGFQSFSFQMMQLLIDLTYQTFNGNPIEQAEAKRALKGMMATTTMLAGVMGLPMMAVVAAAYNGMGSDDDPLDFEMDVKRWMSGIIGADGANFVAHGPVNPLTGATFDSRVSLADIAPFSKFLEDRRELKERLEGSALGWLGPSVGAGVNILAGAAKVADGEIMKGMIAMLPAFMQGPLKAADLATEGFTTGRGDKLPIEATSWDIMVQATNFTPSIKTELQRNTRSEQVRTAILTKRKADLGKKFAKALQDGDVESQQQYGREIAEFFYKNPEMGQFDIGSRIKGQERNQAVARFTETGVSGALKSVPGLVERLQGVTSERLRERLRESQ